LDYDCHIWDGDAYKNYTNNFLGYEDVPSKEEFIKEIKTNNEFANKWGELGPIYGEQWRSWRVGKGIETTLKTEDGETLYEAGSVYIDQITNLVNELKTNPDSRRMMVSAWNVGELDQMVLPPCHYGFQVYTRELSTEEQVKAYEKMGYTKNLDPLDYAPKRAISLMWNQRSVDTFLGLPFNIASYGLLLEIIAREVNMVPDELIGNLGDVHLYSNHIEQAKEQMYRRPYDLPKVQITERDWYLHPLVKLKSEERMFQQKIRSYRPECFELIGYESHPKIKAPLSN
jgi:thymidylate synthase